MQPEKNRNRHVRFDYRFVSLNNTIINEIQDARNFGLSPEWKDWICISKRETINWKPFIHRSLTIILQKFIQNRSKLRTKPISLRQNYKRSDIKTASPNSIQSSNDSLERARLVEFYQPSLNARKQMETNERSWKRYPPIPSIGSGSIRSIAQLDSRADRSIDLSEEVGEIWRRSHVTSDGWLIGKEFQHGNRARNVIFRGIRMWIRFKFSLDRCDKRAVKHNGSGWLSIGKIPIQDFPRNSIRWEGIFLFFLCVDSNGFLGG